MDKNFLSLTPEIGYFVHRKCTPQWFMYEQIIRGWSLTYVISGEAHYSIDGKKHLAKAGDLLCLPPGTIRSGVTYSGRLMECFAADFRLKEAPEEASTLPFSIITHVGIRPDIIQDFHELNFVWMEKQPGYAIRVRGLFLLILSRFMEETIFKSNDKPIDIRIREVLRHINLHYAEKLTVQKAAAVANLNPVYLGSLFKRETGLSFTQYVTQVRIKNAENLLKSGEYKVMEVAELCGFSDVFHFEKRFKNIMGYPPSWCIKQAPRPSHARRPSPSPSRAPLSLRGKTLRAERRRASRED